MNRDSDWVPMHPWMVDYVIREVGDAEDRRAAQAGQPFNFARHLAAHSVVEESIRGICTKTLDMNAPCPYCGKRP